ncbi:hypothetical protein [Janthinobacterium sp.]|uniref:hypothetical protein n=1 Tax=Janthinobacterium sp. TaxID=1871054 RepID=UPI00293D8EFD|nr:hypothetical protein [Janthinobacterium sp.]
MNKVSSLKTTSPAAVAVPAGNGLVSPFPTTASIGAQLGKAAPKAAVKAPAAKAAAKAKPAAKVAAKPAAKPAAKLADKLVAKPAAKAAVKPAAKVAVKPAAKPAVKAAAKAPAKPEVAAASKEKARKPKLVRDSFTMPEAEYAVLGLVKKSCLKAGFEIKKSELLRIGVALISQIDLATLQSVLAALPQLKTGRPKKD